MVFNEKKATALAVIIIEKGAEEKALNSEETYPIMPYLKLIKLMYLCDRYMYKMLQAFITDDDFLAMEYGPVLSNTLSLIRGDDQNKNDQNKNDQENTSFWKKHVETIGFDVQVISNKDIDGLLSDTEKAIAEFYASLFIGVDRWETVDIIHQVCPEWTDPNDEGLGVMPIKIKDIAREIQREAMI